MAEDLRGSLIELMDAIEVLLASPGKGGALRPELSELLIKLREELPLVEAKAKLANSRKKLANSRSGRAITECRVPSRRHRYGANGRCLWCDAEKGDA